MLNARFPITCFQILMNPLNMLTYIYFFQIIFTGMPSASHKTILNNDLENVWKIDIKIKMSEKKHTFLSKCLEKSGKTLFLKY